MANSNKVTIKFLADVDGINKGVQQVNGQLSSFDKGIKNIGGMVAGAFAVSKVLDFGQAAILAASDLAEMESKVQQVFGASGKAALDQWAQSADTAMGLTQTAALDAASSFGIMGDKAGLTGQKLIDFSEGFAQLAGDMASFSNTSVTDALQAIQSGLRGEAEPLRRYGVLLDDATLKQAAMELGIYSGNGALTAQQKILAAQKAIFSQTSKAQGDFARTSDGLANQMRIISAEAGNLQIAFGQSLLKGFGDTSDAGKSMTSVMEQARPYVKQLGEEIGTLGGWAVTAAGYVIGLNDEITKLTALGDNSTGFSFLQGSIGFLSDTIDRVRILSGVWTDNAVATQEAKNNLDGIDGVLVRTGDLAWSTSDAYTASAQSANDFADNEARAAAATKTAADNLKVLTTALENYNKGVSVTKTSIDWERWLDTVSKGWDKGTKSLNDNTEAGRKNIESVLAGVDTISNGYQARLDKGWSEESAMNWALRRFDKIRTTAIAHGFDAAAIDKILNVKGFTAGLSGLETSAGTMGDDIGKALALGIVSGLKSYWDYIYNAGFSSVQAANKGAKAAGMIKSPSKVWQGIGIDLMDGLDLGLKVGGETVLKTVKTQIQSLNDAASQITVTTWDAVAADVASSIDGASLIIEGAHSKYLAVNEVAWTSRLDQFKSTLTTQLGLIQSAYASIQSMSDSITSQVLGGVTFATTGADGKPLTPDQIVTGIFGSLSDIKQAAMIVSGEIGTSLPPALLSQILNMPPDTQIALARYFGTHPEMLTQLALQYDALGIYTQEALGLPMGVAWATVGGESAISMIESAKTTIDAESEAFKKWVRSKLHTKITVDVTYNVTNPQDVMGAIATWEQNNGTKWRTG